MTTSNDMTPEQFAKVRAVYMKAVNLPTNEQDAYISSACTNDGIVATHVRELLAQGEHDDAAVDAIVAGVASELQDRLDDAAAPVNIGPYHLLNTLGRGGMGQVWLAQRADGHFDHKVAIKLVDRRRATAELVSRFRTERQILAGLDHPNIARLFDGGETEDGIPYLVMEYVDGIAVDQYCDQQQLSIRERLRLFLEICEAVEFAHRNLVVHRDIKASNILVTAHGTPKLLDFGIAKLTDAERARDLELHLTADVRDVMTPATASPEQLGGKPVTTATDVYALGHLLYRLLTGAMPYDVDETDRFSLPRAILDQDAAKPSSVAISPANAKARAGTAEQLSRKLAGDLDAIVLKALRKTPTDRYAAPRELAEDVERHLAHHPVRARGEAFSYITQRFLSRHRRALAVAGAVLVMITTLVSFYTAQLATERDRARTEARQSEEVATFLTDLFEATYPDESRGAETTAREMLDRGAERVGAELDSEPEVQVSLMTVIAIAYAKLGLYEPSIDMLDNAIAQRTKYGLAEDADLGTTLHTLGTVHAIEARYDQARPLLEQALDVRLRVHGPRHENTIYTQRELFAIADETANYDEARALLDTIEAAARDIRSESPLVLADVLISRGYLLTKLDELDGAIDALTSSIEIRQSVSGSDHPQTLLAQHALAEALTRAGRREEAEVTLRELLEAQRRVLPADHPQIANAAGSLANVLKYQGLPEEALPLQQEALEILRNAHGDADHPDVSTALNNVGNLLADLRDLDGALALLTDSLEMTRRLYGDDHPEIATRFSNIAAIHADRNDFSKALAMYQQTLEKDIAALGEDHQYVHQDRLAIGVMQRLLGETDMAEKSIRQAFEDTRRVSGEAHPQTFNAMRELGVLLQEQGRCNEAMPLLESAHAGLEAAYPGNPWQVAVASGYLGACEALTDAASGEKRMRVAYERLVEVRGAEDRMTLAVGKLFEKPL
ncbi:MAG: serine/threonine-protein kinase [Pseudomonadota bacterium]